MAESIWHQDPPATFRRSTWCDQPGCTGRALPISDEDHFTLNICLTHLREAVEFAESFGPLREVMFGQREMKASARRPRSNSNVVYYLLFGDRVKIGTSSNLRVRLEGIPHDEVLAVEPGDASLERQRHQEFAGLRITGEWFRYEPPLVAHVATLAVHTPTVLAHHDESRTTVTVADRLPDDTLVTAGDVGYLLSISRDAASKALRRSGTEPAVQGDRRAGNRWRWGDVRHLVHVGGEDLRSVE